ncbi:hypothetical protein A4R26_07855 [Niastella populi]|uniref:Uncharacterized protein n=1 Tax=Niastella populi TaxID=550983 RepID=A0A1V9EKN7_9BACT|nr:hypothetical protein A4R26_07855 [Niastella populi]
MRAYARRKGSRHKAPPPTGSSQIIAVMGAACARKGACTKCSRHWFWPIINRVKRRPAQKCAFINHCHTNTFTKYLRGTPCQYLKSWPAVKGSAAYNAHRPPKKGWPFIENDHPLYIENQLIPHKNQPTN